MSVRSALYPDDWTPAFKEEQPFLQDYSYAGYKNGEKELPNDHKNGEEELPPDNGNVFDVTKFGAEPNQDATEAIKRAIKKASRSNKGRIVFFPEGTYKIKGNLKISKSRVILRGAGSDKTKLLFTSNPGKAQIDFSSDSNVSEGRARMLTEDGKTFATSVKLSDVSGLEPGDDISIGFNPTTPLICER